MNSLGILALVLLGATNILSQDDKTDWPQLLETMTTNWKNIYGYYGKLATTLKEKGYDMGRINKHVPDASQEWENVFNQKYPDEKTKDAIRNDMKEGGKSFPEGNWNEVIVDAVRQTLENAGYAAKEVVTLMGKALVSITGFRSKVKELMTGETEGDADMGRCAENIYQKLIRNELEKPCNATVDGRWDSCKPDCAVFENKSS